jgi:hypothetical protein
MPGMRDLFAHFYVPDEDATATAMRTGLIVPDANVVLNLYRFQRTARDELFGALEKLGDRLWIPHQVGLEFHQSRLAVMADQDDYFDSASEVIAARHKDYLSAVRSFAKRIGLPEFTLMKLEQGIQDAHHAVVTGKFWVDAENDAISPDDHASDPVLARIDALFANENSVGKPMEPKELEDARAEAERRGKEKIPPGYRDKNKTKGDPAGDYLVWRQLMTEARGRKPTAVMLITDDIKEDWYQREQGRTVGARRELRGEMTREAGVPLLIMTTDTFLRRAETYLEAEVSDETIAQAREVPVRYAGLTVLTANLSNDTRDELLESVRVGGMDTSALIVTTAVLARAYGNSEAVSRITQAIQEGHASGKLTTAQTVDAMNVVANYIREQEPQDEPPAEHR